MTTTCKPSPRIAGMWQAELRRMLHPGYRLILRWCEHLPFEDVVRIDHAAITEAATPGVLTPPSSRTSWPV